MKKIGAFEAKTNLSKLLAEVVNRKEEFIIQKRGINVAVLIPFEEFNRKAETDRRKSILDDCRAIRASATEGTVGSYKEWVEEGRKR